MSHTFSLLVIVELVATVGSWLKLTVDVM